MGVISDYLDKWFAPKRKDIEDIIIETINRDRAKTIEIVHMTLNDWEKTQKKSIIEIRDGDMVIFNEDVSATDFDAISGALLSSFNSAGKLLGVVRADSIGVLRFYGEED